MIEYLIPVVCIAIAGLAGYWIGLNERQKPQVDPHLKSIAEKLVRLYRSENPREDSDETFTYDELVSILVIALTTIREDF